MKRAQQKEQTKRLLQQTAIQLFQKQGYSKTTVSQITTEAGVAKGTFFNYFDSKEDVLHTIREHQIAYMEKEAEKVFKEDGEVKQSLYRLWGNIAIHYEEAGRPLIRSLFHILLTDNSFQRKELLQSKKFKEQLIRFFEEGCRKKEFTEDFCLEKMAVTLLHHFTGILFYWCTTEDTPPLPELIHESLPLLFKGILLHS